MAKYDKAKGTEFLPKIAKIWWLSFQSLSKNFRKIKFKVFSFVLIILINLELLDPKKNSSFIENPTHWVATEVHLNLLLI